MVDDDPPGKHWLGWSLDAYAPDEMARRVATVGVGKANLTFVTTLALAVVAGAFVALGSAFSTAAMADTGLAYSLTRIVGGLAFSLALILVIIAGAELFTSNNLLVMAWAGRRIPTWRLLRNWAIVYVGNLIGVGATAALLFAARHAASGEHAVAGQTLVTAATRFGRDVPEAVAVAILGNALVCLAVWLAFSARSTVDKIVAIVPPTTAMVALDLDHVVANLYYGTAALLLVHLDPAAVEASGRADLADGLTVSAFLAHLPAVTVGNLVGGGVLVAAVYWFVYLRPGSEAAEEAEEA